MYDSEHNNHEDKSEIIRRFNEGETIKAIANSMGRTLNSVGNIIAYARKKNPELVPYKSAAMNSGLSSCRNLAASSLISSSCCFFSEARSFFCSLVSAMSSTFCCAATILISYVVERFNAAAIR